MLTGYLITSRVGGVTIHVRESQLFPSISWWLSNVVVVVVILFRSERSWGGSCVCCGYEGTCYQFVDILQYIQCLSAGVPFAVVWVFSCTVLLGKFWSTNCRSRNAILLVVSGFDDLGWILWLFFSLSLLVATRDSRVCVGVFLPSCLSLVVSVHLSYYLNSTCDSSSQPFSNILSSCTH